MSQVVLTAGIFTGGSGTNILCDKRDWWAANLICKCEKEKGTTTGNVESNLRTYQSRVAFATKVIRRSRSELITAWQANLVSSWFRIVRFFGEVRRRAIKSRATHVPPDTIQSGNLQPTGEWPARLIQECPIRYVGNDAFRIEWNVDEKYRRLRDIDSDVIPINGFYYSKSQRL